MKQINELNIYAKLYLNVTRDGLFISGAGKIDSVWEFIMKSFRQLIHCW